MPIQAVEPRRLYRQIAEHIGALINSGEFPPGKKLPPERELARLLGVSRPSLREALIALEIRRLVEIRVGAGIYVCFPLDSAKSAESMTEDIGPGPFELIRARWLIEGEIVALAAKSATSAQLASIREAVEQMVEEDKVKASHEEADRLFHLRIAEATGNSALSFVIRSLWDHRGGAMWSKMQEHVHTPELRPLWIEDHRAILAALEAHDGRRARTAMRAHLRRVEQKLVNALSGKRRAGGFR